MGRLKRLLTASAVAALATAAEAATVKSVTVEPAGDDVRVIVAFDGRFDAPSAFALDGPKRLVIDLPGNSADTRNFAGHGSVSGARTAQFSADKARLVLDLAAPMALGDTQAADNKLTLTLKATDATAFAKLTRGRTKLPGIEAPKPVETAKVEPPASSPLQTAKAPPEKALTTPVRAEPGKPTIIQTAALSPKPTAVRPSAPRAGYRPLVVIDAGHGGHDPGSISVYGGRREKDVTLAIARAIAAEITRSGKARAMLTRSDDRYLVHRQRYEIARRHKAALFISVHADSAPVPEARGATVYTLSEVASDREAARLAAKENSSTVLAGFDFTKESRDVADILIDLAQRETMNASAAFAAVLQREMSPKVHFKSNAHRFAGFLVLKAPDVPSVLLETGYVSNEQDSKFLFSDDGQKAIAEGVAKAVETYLGPRLAQR
jgi:N-acetylmuramoyl-L-alanine amidase